MKPLQSTDYPDDETRYPDDETRRGCDLARPSGPRRQQHRQARLRGAGRGLAVLLVTALSLGFASAATAATHDGVDPTLSFQQLSLALGGDPTPATSASMFSERLVPSDPTQPPAVSPDDGSIVPPSDGCEGFDIRDGRDHDDGDGCEGFDIRDGRDHDDGDGDGGVCEDGGVCKDEDGEVCIPFVGILWYIICEHAR